MQIRVRCCSLRPSPKRYRRRPPTLQLAVSHLLPTHAVHGTNEVTIPSHPQRTARGASHDAMTNQCGPSISRRRSRLPGGVVQGTALASTDAVGLSRLYAALDKPDQAASLICHDLLRLKLLCPNGGMRLFAHKSRPVVFATIVGRVVGVEERERKVIWLGASLGWANCVKTLGSILCERQQQLTLEPLPL